jgi:hypothetical protein
VYDAPFPTDDGVAPTPLPAAVPSVWSPDDAALSGMTLSSDGLTVTSSTSVAYQSIRATNSQTTGKFYIEFKMTAGSLAPLTADPTFGIATAGFTPTDYLGHNPISLGVFSGASNFNRASPNDITSNATVGGVYPALHDVWAVAVDLTAGNFWLAQNNVWFGGGDPATGANPMVQLLTGLLGQVYFPAMSLRGGAAVTGVWTLQPTAASQSYAAPEGFEAWDIVDMSPPITPAPVPPSIPGIVQPVIVTGGQSLPPSFPLGSVGTWLPPPQVGMGGDAPFGTPVVPPGSGNPGVVQPQYRTGSATVPTAASLFPAPTTVSPKPPIVFANVMMIGSGAPPTTPTTPVVPTMAGEDEPGALPDPDEPDPEPAPHRRPARKRH